MTRTRMSKEEIEEVIRMRQDGYSLKDIGRYKHKDHTTILYHCQKAGLSAPQTENTIDRIRVVQKRVELPKLVPIIEDDDEGPRNPGMNYEDYLAIEKKRKWNERKDMAPRRVEEVPYPHIDKLEKEYNEPIQ